MPGGYGHTFAFAGGEAFGVESTAKCLAVLDGPPVHTNHYLDADLARLGPEPSEGSRARRGRLQELISDRRPQSVPDVMDILRDHESSPQAICLHPDPDEGEEASAVVFSMVVELQERRLWVAPGNPCERWTSTGPSDDSSERLPSGAGNRRASVRPAFERRLKEPVRGMR